MLLEKNLKTLPAIVLALMLGACGGDSETNIYAQDVAEPGHEDDHDHDHDDDHDDHDHGDEELSQARLVISESGTGVAYIFDAESAELVSSLNLPAAIGYAYPVPGRRYAALVHRNDNWVSFIDGGVWVEDHGDHDHPYAEMPAIVDFFLDGVRPTHYTFTDEQVAVFYDGNVDTSDVAGVATFDEHTVADNGVAATMQFETHMHGAAQVRGEHLYTTERDPAAASTLPDRVSVYHLHGSEYELETIFEEPCPALHGSAQNEEHVFFACGDGVLMIEEHDGFEVTKITNGEAVAGDSRVGSLRAHEHVEEVIGLVSGNLVRVVPGMVELQAMPAAFPVNEGHQNGAVVAAEFVTGGEHFVALLADGTLVVLDAHDWDVLAEIAVTDASALQEGQRLGLVVQPSGHEAYVINPGLMQVIPVDFEELAAEEPWQLEFVPGASVWLGYGHEEEHDHDH